MCVSHFPCTRHAMISCSKFQSLTSCGQQGSAVDEGTERGAISQRVCILQTDCRKLSGSRCRIDLMIELSSMSQTSEITLHF